MRRAVWTLVLTLLLVFCVDIAFRLADPYTQGGWWYPHARLLFERLQKLSEREPLDTVLMGSSIAPLIDVKRWEAASNKVCYNASLDASAASMHNILLQKYYLQHGIHPRRIIYLTFPPELGGERTLIGNNSNLCWRSHMFRRLHYRYGENPLTDLESAFYLFQARNHIRSQLSTGNYVIYGGWRDDFGVRQAMYGQVDPVCELARISEMDWWFVTDFDHNETGQLASMGDFCREHQIDFTVAVLPMAEWSWARYRDEEQARRGYASALDYLRRHNVHVVELDSVSSQTLLCDGDRLDTHHLNILGGDKVTRRLYRDVFSSGTAAALSPYLVESFAAHLPSSDAVTTQAAQSVPVDATYRFRCPFLSQTQAVAQVKQVEFRLFQAVPPGRYDVIVTAANCGRERLASQDTARHWGDLLLGYGQATLPLMFSCSREQPTQVIEARASISFDTTQTLGVRWLSANDVPLDSMVLCPE